MKRILLAACVVLGQALGADESEPIERIAFGSCYRQGVETEIWEAIGEKDPDVWIWLGDNIYGDSADPDKLRADYQMVKGDAGYAKLRGQCEVLGTWDDHDYGKNNAGKEWEAKDVAQREMLDFLDEPKDSPRRAQEGVYWSYDYGSGERKVKVLLLDVRYHRDDPADPDGDIFGEAQRAWIESELASSDAALVVVASGTQVIPEDHKYEKWAQFPAVRQWFFDQVAANGIRNLVFLSGDRHIAEISAYQPDGHEHPLYDFTSSSLTHSWESFPGEPNRHRAGEVFHSNNFGLLEIDWDKRELRGTICDEAGKVVLEQVIVIGD